MAFVTFKEYTDFGYDVIPEGKFNRYIFKAGSMVGQWTLGRVTDNTELTERNKRGICEIADIVFKQENPATGESGSPIKSFSNEGYSETLANVDIQDAALVFERDIANAMTTYFTPEQLCRRGGC